MKYVLKLDSKLFSDRGDPFVLCIFVLDCYEGGSRYKQEITPKNGLDYVML